MTVPPSVGGLKNLDFPWKRQADEVACNFAVGHLAHNLYARVTVEGRIHAETYVAAAGTIAGFAAQRSLFARIGETNDVATLGQIQVANSKNGDKYFFGDPLNDMLLGTPDVAPNERLWPLVAGGAVAAGLNALHLPDVGKMFGHVAKHLGGEGEGMPSVPQENFPYLAPKAMLKVLWPLAAMCFSGQFPGEARPYGVAPPRFWPAITGYVANKVIREVAAVLDPRKSLIILMETAIYASKLDPAIVAAEQPIGGPAAGR